MIKFVEITTPYPGTSLKEIKQNILYARACVRDSLLKGEIPFASHLLFTQPGIIDENEKQESYNGILAGKMIIESLPDLSTIVYNDRGITKNMEFAIARATENNRNIEYRTLGEFWQDLHLELAKKHRHYKAWKNL